MNIKQLQVLISAGVFSATLMSGTAYAVDVSTETSKVQVSSGTKAASGKAGPQDKKEKTEKKAKKSEKTAAQHDCTSGSGCAADK